MDGYRFDRITKHVFAGSSRREALRWLARSLIGSLTGLSLRTGLGADTECAGQQDSTPCSGDGNQCTDDICVGGSCTHPNKSDGAPCDDGNLCTQNDLCQDGVCIGGALVVCPSSSVCQTASCDPTIGCVSDNLPDGTLCGDGQSCCGGQCVNCPSGGQCSGPWRAD